MPDQIIDAVMAQALQVDALRSGPLLAWIVLREEAEYPDQLVARLVTSGPTPYVLLSDTLSGIHAQLPPDLELTNRHPSDPIELLEVWLAP